MRASLPTSSLQHWHCRLCRGRVNTPESVMTGVTPQCCPGMFIDVTAPVSSWTRVILANIWLGTALTMVIYLSICRINVMLVFSDITPPDDGGYRRNWCSILSFYHRNHFTTTPAAVATLPSPLLKILWVLDASETDNKIVSGDELSTRTSHTSKR